MYQDLPRFNCGLLPVLGPEYQLRYLSIDHEFNCRNEGLHMGSLPKAAQKARVLWRLPSSTHPADELKKFLFFDEHERVKKSQLYWKRAADKGILQPQSDEDNAELRFPGGSNCGELEFLRHERINCVGICSFPLSVAKEPCRFRDTEHTLFSSLRASANLAKTEIRAASAYRDTLLIQPSRLDGSELLFSSLDISHIGSREAQSCALKHTSSADSSLPLTFFYSSLCDEPRVLPKAGTYTSSTDFLMGEPPVLSLDMRIFHSFTPCHENGRYFNSFEQEKSKEKGNYWSIYNSCYSSSNSSHRCQSSELYPPKECSSLCSNKYPILELQIDDINPYQKFVYYRTSSSMFVQSLENYYGEASLAHGDSDDDKCLSSKVVKPFEFTTNDFVYNIAPSPFNFGEVSLLHSSKGILLYDTNNLQEKQCVKTSNGCCRPASLAANCTKKLGHSGTNLLQCLTYGCNPNHLIVADENLCQVDLRIRSINPIFSATRAYGVTPTRVKASIISEKNASTTKKVHLGIFWKCYTALAVQPNNRHMLAAASSATDTLDILDLRQLREPILSIALPSTKLIGSRFRSLTWHCEDLVGDKSGSLNNVDAFSWKCSSVITSQFLMLKKKAKGETFDSMEGSARSLKESSASSGVHRGSNGLKKPAEAHYILSPLADNMDYISQDQKTIIQLPKRYTDLGNWSLSSDRQFHRSFGPLVEGSRELWSLPYRASDETSLSRIYSGSAGFIRLKLPIFSSEIFSRSNCGSVDMQRVKPFFLLHVLLGLSCTGRLCANIYSNEAFFIESASLGSLMNTIVRPNADYSSSSSFTRLQGHNFDNLKRFNPLFYDINPLRMKKRSFEEILAARSAQSPVLAFRPQKRLRMDFNTCDFSDFLKKKRINNHSIIRSREIITLLIFQALDSYKKKKSVKKRGKKYSLSSMGVELDPSDSNIEGISRYYPCEYCGFIMNRNDERTTLTRIEDFLRNLWKGGFYYWIASTSGLDHERSGEVAIDGTKALIHSMGSEDANNLRDYWLPHTSCCSCVFFGERSSAKRCCSSNRQSEKGSYTFTSSESFSCCENIRGPISSYAQERCVEELRHFFQAMSAFLLHVPSFFTSPIVSFRWADRLKKHIGNFARNESPLECILNDFCMTKHMHFWASFEKTNFFNVCLDSCSAQESRRVIFLKRLHISNRNRRFRDVVLGIKISPRILSSLANGWVPFASISNLRRLSSPDDVDFGKSRFMIDTGMIPYLPRIATSLDEFLNNDANRGQAAEKRKLMLEFRLQSRKALYGT